MTEVSPDRVVRTFCLECDDNCPVDVYVEGDRAVRVEIAADADAGSPRSCERVGAALERVYSPHRLLYPQKRVGERGAGRWQRISWDEALDTIASRMKEARQKHGAEAVALAKGVYCRQADYVSRLGNAFGTPNVTSIDNTCYIPSAAGRLLTYGFDGSPDLAGGPECVVLWGNSPNPPLPEGTRLIVVNCMKTAAAERADLWLRPRPGSDLALALGVLNVIVEERLYDQAFVAEWTVGLADLAQHLQQYTPAWAAELTWVPEEQIVAAARMFAAARPGCLWNGNAGDDVFNSTQTARAFAIMQAICGNLDVPGGTCHFEGFRTYEGTGWDIRRDLLSAEQAAKRLGADYGYLPPDELWDSVVWKPAEVKPQHVVDAILTGEPYPVEVMGVIGSNPVLTWSNSRRVREALVAVDFFFVVDLVMTPTAALADIVLPVTSYLETDAVVVTGGGSDGCRLLPLRKAVQVGECRSDLDILRDLAARLGLEEYFGADLHAMLDDYLAPMGVTFAELCRRPGLPSSCMRYRKYLNDGFNTPSGKVELVSSLCERWGFDPLPVYHEPEESPFSAPEMLKEYPLVVANAHEPEYMHSQDRFLKGLRARVPDPLVNIHPDTAADLGIAEGDWVYIENERGRIRQRATLDSGLDPRVINIPHGWWYPERGQEGGYGWEEANANILTDDGPPYGPEMGSPKMRGFLCRVYKAD